MRENMGLYRGKRTDNGEWVEGSFFYDPNLEVCMISGFDYYTDEDGLQRDYFNVDVDPETVGECTGLREFVIADKSFTMLLFEGDIVEVWGHRRPSNENYPVSKYDHDYKVRGIVVYKQGEWKLDFDNDYNHTIEKLRGNEQNERTVSAFDSLCHYGYHEKNEDWHREHNSHYKWKDIWCIGNIFDNPELLNR